VKAFEKRLVGYVVVVFEEYSWIFILMEFEELLILLRHHSCWWELQAFPVGQVGATQFLW
jgi:hypothetical protein